jgi:hypothetical protein
VLIDHKDFLEMENRRLLNQPDSNVSAKVESNYKCIAIVEEKLETVNQFFKMVVFSFYNSTSNTKE